MLEAIARLRAAGYDHDIRAAPDGQLRCGGCGELLDPHDLVTDEIARFEGESNPDDEAILVALTTPRGHRGLYSSAYGPDTPVEDVAILQAMARR